MSDMFTKQSFVEIEKEELLERVREMHAKGYTLLMMSVHHKTLFELMYSFEKGYELITLRTRIEAEDEIESVCKLYPYSYIYENEAKELYGIKVKNMDMDFKGHLYKKSMLTPFAPKQEGE